METSAGFVSYLFVYVLRRGREETENNKGEERAFYWATVCPIILTALGLPNNYIQLYVLGCYAQLQTVLNCKKKRGGRNKTTLSLVCAKATANPNTKNS